VRWFVVFLLVANVILFFWAQQQSAPEPGSGALPPPDIGRLRLISEVDEAAAAAEDAPRSVPAEAPALSEAPAVAAQPMVREPPGAPPRSAGAPVDEALTPDGGEDKAQPSAADATVAAQTEAPTAHAGAAPPSPADQSTPAAQARPAGDAASMQARSDEPAVADIAPRQAPAEAPIDETAPDPQDQAPSVAEPAEPQQHAVADDEALNTAMPERTAACARLGPFDPEAADALLESLPANLRLLSDVSEEQERVIGHYVMIPPLPTRAAGNQKLKELADAGFEDTWLFRDGANRNAISLGLFSREEGARRHAESLAQKGFATEIKTAITRTERRWLLLQDISGADPAASLPLPDPINVEPWACP
jgi:hypothetical protein